MLSSSRDENGRSIDVYVDLIYRDKFRDRTYLPPICHICILLLIGLSEAVGNVLHVARVSGARSHGFFVYLGTSSFFVHPLQYQRRPYSSRCAKRLLHRSVRLILF